MDKLAAVHGSCSSQVLPGGGQKHPDGEVPDGLRHWRRGHHGQWGRRACASKAKEAKRHTRKEVMKSNMRTRESVCLTPEFMSHLSQIKTWYIILNTLQHTTSVVNP